MEKAANDVLEQSAIVESLNRAVQNIGNEPTAVVLGGGGGGYGYGYGYPYPYYYPVDYYYVYYPMFGNMPYSPGYGYGYGGYGGYGGGGPPGVVQNSGSSADPAKLMKSLSEAQAALANTQKTLAMASNRAIRDTEGRIVAVRLEE